VRIFPCQYFFRRNKDSLVLGTDSFFCIGNQIFYWDEGFVNGLSAQALGVSELELTFMGDRKERATGTRKINPRDWEICILVDFRLSR
jgi:hypothetical protein